jgi:ferredoxin-type protein NapH
MRWGRLRRLSQVAFLLVFVGLPFTYLKGQITVMGTLASLRIGPISLVDPVSGLASMIAAGDVGWTLVSGMILPVVLALALGPVFCSWVCPWGLLSEFVDTVLRRKVGRIPSWLGPLRWSFLGGVLLLGLATGMPLAATISAPRLVSVLPMEIIFLGGATAGTLGLLGVLLVLEVILPRRLWCRALCPVGSTLVLLRLRKTLTIAWSEPTCRPELQGATCFVKCPWNIDPRHMGIRDGCTNCGACVEGCPSGPSLDFSFGRREPERPPRPNLPVMLR